MTGVSFILGGPECTSPASPEVRKAAGRSGFLVTSDNSKGVSVVEFWDDKVSLSYPLKTDELLHNGNKRAALIRAAARHFPRMANALAAALP